MIDSSECEFQGGSEVCWQTPELTGIHVSATNIEEASLPKWHSRRLEHRSATNIEEKNHEME